uniref:U3 small nucleolar RNA-interacting protein 2-like n=1 Tax=Phallusia mammillata TaxID=59560 RepID=A0A6F9DRZ7_9ASCI|nr:U3 small nucleolar RNA-interacting protein 2-like [Phallusia mammillata]
MRNQPCLKTIVMVLLRTKKRTSAGNDFSQVEQQKAPKRKLKEFDDEISSGSEDGDLPPPVKDLPDSSDEDETAQEKKMRLTKKYLEQLQTVHAKDDSDNEKDVVGDILKEDVLEKAGRLQRKIADLCVQPSEDNITRLRGHKLSVTCLAVSASKGVLFTASKDCSINKWCLNTHKKLFTVKGTKPKPNQKAHSAHVLSLALTTDFKFLASAGKDKIILVWNPDTMEYVHTFRGHRNTISGVAFRLNSTQLFSSSHDRTVKVWDVGIMSYVETLYGHQESVEACDSLTRERCVSCGGRDRSARIWKIVEESQLVYHGHTGSIDCIRYINEEYMISGSDDGSICIWSIMKKKPIVIIRDAHKDEKKNNWISSVAALPNSDLLATGSSNGLIRLWKCSDKFLQLLPLFDISACGFVNDLRFTDKGNHLIAAIGQEHKLGRWWSIKSARNSTMIIPLKQNI